MTDLITLAPHLDAIMKAADGITPVFADMGLENPTERDFDWNAMVFLASIGFLEPGLKGKRQHYSITEAGRVYRRLKGYE